MNEPLVELLIAVVSGLITGAVTYGAISVKLEWQRADIEAIKTDIRRAHTRIDMAFGRRSTDGVEE